MRFGRFISCRTLATELIAGRAHSARAKADFLCYFLIPSPLAKCGGGSSCDVARSTLIKESHETGRQAATKVRSGTSSL